MATQPTEVRAVIWNYIEDAEGSTVPVSDAMRFVRERIPHYDGSERELSDLVGALATAAGRSVHFDEPDEV